jgi:LacI family transcriptional regulator
MNRSGIMPNYIKLKDIADEIGVSVTTISKVINNHPDISPERRAQIQKLLEEKNYVPDMTASNLRTKKSKFIGLITPDITNPYYAGQIKSIGEILTAGKYHMIVCSSNEDIEAEKEFIKNLISIKAAGVIITPAQGSRKNISLLRQYDIPYVIANRDIAPDEDNYVVVDNEKIGYAAAKHLLEKKPDARVVHLTMPYPAPIALKRRFGYIRALNEHGMQYDENDLYNNVISADDGYAAAQKIMRRRSLPLSILCFSDQIAIGVMKYMNKNYIKIPKEIAVMGVDDIEYAGFANPELTTIAIPKNEIGIKSANLLLELIKEKESEIKNKNETNPDRRIILETQLVVRQST